MIIRVLQICLICLCYEIYSQSNDRWINIASDIEGEYYMDLETFYYDGANQNNIIWVKYIYNNKDMPDPDKNYLDYLLYKFGISCKNRTIEVFESYTYLVKGDVIHKEDYEKNDIVPETVGEAMYKFLCK